MTIKELEERKMQIQADLATIFSEDLEFLKKINGITFGLMKRNNKVLDKINEF